MSFSAQGVDYQALDLLDCAVICNRTPVDVGVGARRRVPARPFCSHRRR
jgi:hypothetical protein